jgi:predicted nucleic acid-binding protein
MAAGILIDSDVLVWLTRGHPGAAQRLHEINPWRISVVTYIELAQGCRDKAELARLKKGLTARGTEVLPVTPAISQRRAADLIDTLALSHSMRLADALIGATALEHDLTLLTANTKHFGAVEGLQVEAFAP